MEITFGTTFMIVIYMPTAFASWILCSAYSALFFLIVIPFNAQSHSAQSDAEAAPFNGQRVTPISSLNSRKTSLSARLSLNRNAFRAYIPSVSLMHTHKTGFTEITNNFLGPRGFRIADAHFVKMRGFSGSPCGIASIVTSAKIFVKALFASRHRSISLFFKNLIEFALGTESFYHLYTIR